MDKAKIGTFIKEQRMALGMTQQQLAEQLHITINCMSRIRLSPAGRPAMPTRTLLCWMIWRLRCRYRLKSFVAVSGLPCPLLTPIHS